MLAVPRIQKSLAEVLAGPPLDAAVALEASIVVPAIVFFQEHPDIAAEALTGIAVPTHQRTMLLQEALGSRENLYVCSRGTAKCLARGTRVIMADGALRCVEDVRVGEEVMGPDNAPRLVLATSTGVGPLFRVKQTSGMDYVVNDAHILSTKKARGAAGRQTGVFAQWPGTIVNIPVQDYAAQPAYVRGLLRGYRAGRLQFASRPVRLDPYFLGLWLGDGTGATAGVTTADVEVVEYLSDFGASWGAQWQTVTVKAGSKASTYNPTFAPGTPRVRSYNPIKNALDYYGVRTKAQAVRTRGVRGSSNKHIPEDYICNDEETRLQVLAGLVDADGCIDHGGYSITQVSERLIRDIKRLADTLGFRTKLRSTTTTCPGIRGPVHGRAWRLAICGDVWRIPCRIARKRIHRHQLRKNKDFLLSQLTIESAGIGEWAGFVIEGDHLFLLEDGTVTHNTTTIDGISTVLGCVFLPNSDAVLLHGAGFRGGQMLFNEVQRWLEGGWDSQLATPPFLATSIRNPKIVSRMASYWEMDFESHTKYTAVPTQDPDRILGMRAKRLRVDEANTADALLIEKTAKPFLNVKGDFRHGGAYSASNTISYTTTIDYTFRPFQKTITAAKNALELDFAAYKALCTGNVKRYRELVKGGTCRFTYTTFDYSDVMIRSELTDPNGNRYGVHWPNKDIPVTHLANGVPFTERGVDGVMVIDAPACDVYCTYPIDFEQIEGSLRSGAADQTTWKQEQRNIADSAAGDVYPHQVVDAACCFGARYILPYSRLGDAWKLAHADVELDYTAPVLWRCSDPCIMGIDYAGGDRDFTAYTIIRIGPMAQGAFDPFTHSGKTPWSNVVWCEQHHHSSHDDVRAKINQLRERYNIVYFHDKMEQDPWKVCRGIGLDMRGGGVGVRDSLVYINEQTLPPGAQRIYDPLDKDERVVGYSTDPGALPMLDTIWPQDTLNEKLVEFTLGQLQTNLLYIPKFLQPSERSADRALDPAYEACRLLCQQLRKLQQENTARARKFYMPGNKESVEGKKDLWSSFIYAGKELRAHLIRLQLVTETRPPMGGKISRIGSTRNRGGMNGKAPGSKYR